MEAERTINGLLSVSFGSELMQIGDGAVYHLHGISHVP